MIKIDIGSGKSKRPGYITIDNDPVVKPDLLHNIETTALPYIDNSIDEIRT